MSSSPSLQSGRVIDAALACIARVGVGKTTLDDVAREAGCARATVYRCFPNRQALFRAVLDQEVAALGARVLDAAEPAANLGDAIASVMLSAAETFRSHAALAFVVEHEPEIVTPELSFDRGSALLLAASVLVAPAFTRFLEIERAERLGEWVTRLTLSYLCNPSEQVQLDDPAHVRAFVYAYILPGATRNLGAFEYASASAGEGASQ